MEAYVLEIEPDPQLVPTARMFAATIARQFGCAEDAVLDVKIAVSEACTSAVQLRQAGELSDPVRLSATEDGNNLIYEVTDTGGTFADAPGEPSSVFDRALDGSGDDAQMRLALVRALFPGAEIGSSGSGSALRFRVER